MHSRYMLRNSMGACTMVQVPKASRGVGPTTVRGGGGGGGVFYPMAFSTPTPRFMYPSSPIRATALPFYPSSHQAYYDQPMGVAKRSPDQVVMKLKEMGTGPGPGALICYIAVGGSPCRFYGRDAIHTCYWHAHFHQDYQDMHYGKNVHGITQCMHYAKISIAFCFNCTVIISASIAAGNYFFFFFTPVFVVILWSLARNFLIAWSFSL